MADEDLSTDTEALGEPPERDEATDDMFGAPAAPKPAPAGPPVAAPAPSPKPAGKKPKADDFEP